MKFLSAIAFIAFATSAFAAPDSHYNFQAVTSTGQVISGYTMASFGDPAINNRGEVVFSASVAAPFGGSTFLTGIFSPTQLEAITTTFGANCLGPVIVNDFGQIAFIADSKISPTQVFVSGVYETDPPSQNPVQIVAPGATIDGVQLVANVCQSTNVFSFNDSGRIAFVNTGGPYLFKPSKGVVKPNLTKSDGYRLTVAGLVDGKAGELLFIGQTDSFQGIFTRHRLVLRTGERIDGVKLNSISLPVSSKNGNLAFIGSYGTNGSALFTEHSVVAKVGKPVAGRVISAFFGEPAINDQGEVVFEALTGAGTYPNDAAIFSHNHVVISAGDSIGGRTITSLRQPAVNESGVIAFQAVFSDGSQSVVVAQPR